MTPPHPPSPLRTVRLGLHRFASRTIHKNDENARALFSQVMAYGPPKPRNAIKDFKVYPWAKLDAAVLKVLAWDSDPKRRAMHAPDTAAAAAAARGAGSPAGSGSSDSDVDASP